MESIWLDPNQAACAAHNAYVTLATPEGKTWTRAAQLVMSLPPAIKTRTKSAGVTTTPAKINYAFIEAGTLITEIYISGGANGFVEFRCHPDDDFVPIGTGITLQLVLDPNTDPDRIPEIRTSSGSDTVAIITSVIS